MTDADKKTGRAKDGGFSMLELIVYIGLVGVVLTAAVLFSVEFVTAKAKASAVSGVSRAASFALERMAYEIRMSDGIDYDMSAFGPDPGILQLRSSVPSADPVVFSVTDGRLYAQWGAGAPAALTPSDVVVSGFTLEDVSVRPRFRSVRIRLTVDRSADEAGDSYSSRVMMETTARSWRNDGFSLPTP